MTLMKCSSFSPFSAITRRDALAEVPGDADDDIVALVDTVESSAVDDAVDSMESNAHRDLESAHDTGEQTKEEAEDGEQTSNEAASAYSEVAGTRFAGEAADAQSQAEQSAEEFAEMGEETDQVLTEGDSEYEQFLQEIMGG